MYPSCQEKGRFFRLLTAGGLLDNPMLKALPLFAGAVCAEDPKPSVAANGDAPPADESVCLPGAPKLKALPLLDGLPSILSEGSFNPLEPEETAAGAGLG